MEIPLRIIKVSRFYLALLFPLFSCAAAFAAATTIPFLYENRIPFVQVQPQSGQRAPLCFILDTGASTTVVGSATVDRLQLGYYKTSPPVNNFETSTTCGLGNSPAGYFHGLRATCGGLPLKSTALKTDISNMSLCCGRQVDGLMGTDFFRDKILTINFARRILQIEQAPGTDGACSRVVQTIPADLRNAVFANISTPLSSRPLVFLVDTGTTHCIIDLQAAKRLNLSFHSERSVNVIGGTKDSFTADHFVGSFEGYRLPSQIFVVDLSQVAWSLGRHVDGILGMNFMENYTARINFHTRQMQILPYGLDPADLAAR
jgi:predicted aspartyl protease